MAFYNTADSEQMRILAEAFEAHCKARGIASDISRENTARLVMWLFGGGVTTLEQLAGALSYASMGRRWPSLGGQSCLPQTI